MKKGNGEVNYDVLEKGKSNYPPFFCLFIVSQLRKSLNKKRRKEKRRKGKKEMEELKRR